MLSYESNTRTEDDNHGDKKVKVDVRTYEDRYNKK